MAHSDNSIRSGDPAIIWSPPESPRRPTVGVSEKGIKREKNGSNETDDSNGKSLDDALAEALDKLPDDCAEEIAEQEQNKKLTLEVAYDAERALANQRSSNEGEEAEEEGESNGELKSSLPGVDWLALENEEQQQEQQEQQEQEQTAQQLAKLTREHRKVNSALGLSDLVEVSGEEENGNSKENTRNSSNSTPTKVASPEKTRDATKSVPTTPINTTATTTTTTATTMTSPRTGSPSTWTSRRQRITPSARALTSSAATASSGHRIRFTTNSGNNAALTNSEILSASIVTSTTTISATNSTTSIVTSTSTISTSVPTTSSTTNINGSSPVNTTTNSQTNSRNNSTGSNGMSSTAAVTPPTITTTPVADLSSSSATRRVSMLIPTSTSAAPDMLILMQLNLGSIQPLTWRQCSPEQLWFYFPLLVKIDPKLDTELLKTVVPYFTHKTDVSVRQQVFWLSSIKILQNAEEVFGPPEEDQKATKQYFEGMVKQKPKQGEVNDLMNLNICDPIFGVPSLLASLKVLKIFKAHSAPALCEIHYKDSSFPPRKFIFKHGDDLRSDMFVQIMFFIFNKMWENSNMKKKPRIHQYRVMPIGQKTGFVEFIPSRPVQDFSWETVGSWTPQMKDKFIITAAGAFIGSYILGIRDRHKDNMLIAEDGSFFHIDFGYMFNKKTWFDANRFAIPEEIRIHFSAQFPEFLDLIKEGYRVLRRNASLISNLCQKIFVSQAYTPEDIVACLSHCFYDTWVEDVAVAHVHELALKGDNSPKKKLKDMVHNFESQKN